MSISYWFDDWGAGVLAPLGSRHPKARQSLAMAVNRNEPLLDITIQLCSDQYVLIWRRTRDGQYSANSFYKLIAGGGKIRWSFRKIWKYRIPPSVRVFVQLFLLDRILTADVMQTRNINCQPNCVMCADGQVETAWHLIFNCNFAAQVWETVARLTGLNMLLVQETVLETWYRSSDRFSGTRRRKWSIVFSATCWMLWKQRNLKFFEGRTAPPGMVASWIVQEAALWEKFCK